MIKTDKTGQESSGEPFSLFPHLAPALTTAKDEEQTSALHANLYFKATMAYRGVSVLTVYW